MARKEAAAKGKKRGAFFIIDGGRAITTKRYCPRCGPGVMMADHKDRTACGKCGYTEFKK